MIETNSTNSSNRLITLGDAGGIIEVEVAAQTMTLSGVISNAGTSGSLTTGGDG